MTPVMRRVCQMRRLKVPMRILSVAFFALLLLFGTTIEATHSHADAAAHSTCALCQTAHGVVSLSALPCIHQVFIVATRIEAPFERPYREHVFSFSHCNRPPPAVSAFV